MRRLQIVFQAIRPPQPRLQLPRRRRRRRRRDAVPGGHAAQEPMPAVPFRQVPGARHAARGSAARPRGAGRDGMSSPVRGLTGFQLPPASVSPYSSGSPWYQGGPSPQRQQQLSACLSGLLSGLVRSDHRPRPLPPSPLTTCPQLGVACCTGDWARELLAAAVEWARRAPFFAELGQADQLSLLQASWGQLLVLTQLQQSAAEEPPDPRRPTIGCPAAAAALRLGQLHADVAELACLKALALLNPDCPGLREPGRVEAGQSRVQWALAEYCRLRLPVSAPDAAGGCCDRFGRLLLRLQSLALAPPPPAPTPLEAGRLVRDLLLAGPPPHCRMPPPPPPPPQPAPPHPPQPPQPPHTAAAAAPLGQRFVGYL
uniref:NR LBD domain-containing protein n=1 Tax=Macrostomum lignano TaxID=282301 RepID=A0A1I8HD27_9PLAT